MSEEKLNEIYRAGFCARLAGVDKSPHPIGTPEYENWCIGWVDQDDHLTKRDAALGSIGWFGPRQ